MNLFADVQIRARDLHVRDADATVALAGRHAHDASRDARLRELAARITEDVLRVDLNGAEAIGDWVRKTIRYRQETPGVEVLQGPYTTLKTRVGDCDDLVILWVTLCRSIGINATFAGVRAIGSSEYVHAIGYLPDEKTFVELTDDRAYGGRRLPLLSGKLPKGYEARFYSPASEKLERALEGGVPAHRSAMRLIDRPGFGLAAAAIVLGILTWRS